MQGGKGAGGVEILIVTSWYGNQDKLRPDGWLCSCADVTIILIVSTSTDGCLFIVNFKAIQQSLDLLVPSILQISAVKWWALLWRQSLFASSSLPSLY